jgi:hypothetical protein
MRKPTKVVMLFSLGESFNSSRPNVFYVWQKGNEVDGFWWKAEVRDRVGCITIQLGDTMQEAIDNAWNSLCWQRKYIALSPRGERRHKRKAGN